MAENFDSSDRRSQIERILKLATDGKLTTAQAAELIAALGEDTQPHTENKSESEASSASPGGRAGADRDADFDEDFEDDDDGGGDSRRAEREERRRRRRHRHRHRHQGASWSGFRFEGPDHLAKDIERA